MNAPAIAKDLPGAFMGYARGPNGGIAVRICAWHADRAEAEAWAGDMPKTHGICLACSKTFAGEQTALPLTCQSVRTSTTHNHKIQ